jgi:hypothetical protein
LDKKIEYVTFLAGLATNKLSIWARGFYEFYWKKKKTSFDFFKNAVDGHF